MSLPHTLRCLGRPALLGADGSPIHLKSRKHLAILIYLAVDGKEAVRRDYLADLLWSGAPSQKARHSLGVALTGLRHRVDPRGFPSDHTHVRMTAELEVDLDRLERGEVLATDLLPALELDAFLEDFEIDDAPGFNHWREGQRARLWPHIESALVRQMDHCRRTGDFVAIERLATRLQDNNAFSEPAVRARIEARAFAGDRIGALQAFEAWRHALHSVLGAEPSAEIEAMARRLRRGTREGGGDGNRLRVPAEQWRDRPFIGRAAEYRALYEAWERTTQGEPWHALVLGESGIGKSTLIQRLLTAASLEGAVTSRVQCYELERGIPYAAIGVLVRGLLERPEALATSPESLADLAQAVPAVYDHVHNLPTPLQLTGESFRIRITDAMEALLRSIAEEVPVILVVDDFHMADDASASVIHLLARRFETERVMLALAVRPTTPQESPNIAKLRENHQRLGFLSLEVPPMAGDEAAAMLDALTADGPAPGKTVRDAMLRGAGGYPMALELFVSEWIASGEESLALAVPAMREELGHRPPPEDAYRMALERIIEGLDGPTRRVLQLAAVLGARLNDLELYRIVDLGLGTVGEAMTTLRTMRLLRETEERLEFVNELIRGHAYLRTPKPFRTALHGEVVRQLLEAEANKRPIPGLEIAWHLIRAGRFEEAIPYLLRGARESMRGGAAHEAERGLATAMDRLKEPEKSEALLLLGEALQEQGRTRESVTFLERIDPAARRHILSRRDVLVLYASSSALLESWAEMESVAMRLVQHGRTAEQAATRLRALWCAACCNQFRLKREFILEIWCILQQEPIEGLSPDERGEYSLVQAYCQYQLGEVDASLLGIAAAIEHLERDGVLNSVYLSLVNGHAACLVGIGRYDQAIVVAERGYVAARKAGNDNRARSLAGVAALCAYRLEDRQKQLDWSARVLAPIEDSLPVAMQLRNRFAHAHALAHLGRIEEARTDIEAGDALLKGKVESWLDQMWLLYKADFELTVGNGIAAQRLGRLAVTNELGQLLCPTHAGRFARWTARIGATELDQRDRAVETLSDLRKCYGRFDCVDQAEVLNAVIWLDSKCGRASESDLEELRQKLHGLPPGITNELVKAGMLDLGGDLLGPAALPKWASPPVPTPRSRI